MACNHGNHRLLGENKASVRNLQRQHRVDLSPRGHRSVCRPVPHGRRHGDPRPRGTNVFSGQFWFSFKSRKHSFPVPREHSLYVKDGLAQSRRHVGFPPAVHTKTLFCFSDKIKTFSVGSSADVFGYDGRSAAKAENPSRRVIAAQTVFTRTEAVM